MQIVLDVSFSDKILADMHKMEPWKKALSSLADDLLMEQWPGEERPQQIAISLVFLTAEEIEDLNAQYRGLPEPTDVLSFPLWEEEGNFSPSSNWQMLELGDIVVCPSVVSSNAAEKGIPFEEELALVIIHGLLHLVGYDHDTPEKEKHMWDLQSKWLERALCMEGLLRVAFNPKEG